MFDYSTDDSYADLWTAVLSPGLDAQHFTARQLQAPIRVGTGKSLGKTCTHNAVSLPITKKWTRSAYIHKLRNSTLLPLSPSEACIRDNSMQRKY